MWEEGEGGAGVGLCGRGGEGRGVPGVGVGVVEPEVGEVFCRAGGVLEAAVEDDVVLFTP